MNLRKTYIVLACLFTFPGAFSSDIRIGLFYNSEIKSIVFSVIEGEYVLLGNGNQAAVITEGSVLYLEREGTGIAVSDTSHTYGIFRTLEFKGVSANNIFQVKPVMPSGKAKESDDNLIVNTMDEWLRLINVINLEKYIPGTVEAEGGSSAAPEFYKAQAVIARTFAVKSMFRHAHEGFNICDGVHCQAFNGKSRNNKEIYAATSLTHDEILVSGGIEPVTAAYHACCGGQTADASVEWNRPLFYLVSVKDPFCTKSSNTNWSKTISTTEWNNYILGKYFTGNPSDLFEMKGNTRFKFLDAETKKLAMTAVREDFKLKSSYFTVIPGNSAGTVEFKGHGYGHGLGLCQEGAMEMARVGYTYVDILMFYYRGVKIMTMNIE